MEPAKQPGKPEPGESGVGGSPAPAPGRGPRTADKPAGQPAQKAPKDGEPRPAPRKA